MSTIHCQNFRGFGYVAVEQLSKETCIIQWWERLSAKSVKYLVLKRVPCTQNISDPSEILNDSR